MKGLKITLTIIFIAIVGSYALFQASDFIRGPVLVITSPQNGTLFTDPVFVLEGTTKNISFMYINGAQTFVNEDGEFSEKLLLSEGYNIMTVRVTDRFNREALEELHYILKPNE